MSVQVPKGYKQTEVGVIPEDWEVEKLADLVDPNRTIRYGIVQPGQYSLNGRYMIRGQDYSRGWVDSIEVFRVSESKEKPFENARVKKGDVLITIVGASTGHIAMVPDWLDGANLTQTTARIAPKKNIDSKFLSYILFSPIGKLQVANYIKGAAQPGLNCGDIEKFLIPVPVIHEQQAIAEALSDADALIESLEQLIVKKRQIKQGAMQELLTGQRRLPGFSGEWRVRHLGDIAEVVMGQSPSSVYYNRSGAGLPLIQGNADVKDRKTIKRVFTTQVSKYGFCGDILLSVRAPVGEVSIAVFDVCLGRGVCAIRYPNKFLYHALIAKEPVWKNISKGSTFDSVNSADVKAFEIFMPLDEVEQKAIATLLNEMDTELSTLESRLDKARQIKQAMMQELLTGHIRLL